MCDDCDGSFLSKLRSDLSAVYTQMIFLKRYETTVTNVDISWPVMRSETLGHTSLTMKVTQIFELHRIKMESCRSDLNLLHSHLRSAQLIASVSR